MYETFVEETAATPVTGLRNLLRSNVPFLAGCCLLILLTAGAFYGLMAPQEKYAEASKFTAEHRNPPTLRRYILVQQRLNPDGDIFSNSWSPQNRTQDKWKPKPVAYQPQGDEIVFRDDDGQPKIFEAHPFGTDSQGRDIFVRTLVGTHVYFLPSLIAVGFSILIGVPLGILGADIWTGRVVRLLQFLAQCLIDVLEALPKYITILLAIILIPPALRHFQWHGIQWYGFYWLSIILGILSAPKLGKLIMERIDILKKREFIEAAEAMGLSKFSVALRHVIRYNCLPLFFTQAAVLVTDVILIEIVLSYLSDVRKEWGRGITVLEPNPSWGNLLVNGRYNLFTDWWMSFFPLLIVLLWISAAYLFTYGLNKILVEKRTQTELW